MIGKVEELLVLFEDRMHADGIDLHILTGGLAGDNPAPPLGRIETLTF
jgi:hypothetical protein